MAQLSPSLGSSTSVFNHQKPAPKRSSFFDLSRITNFTCDSGMIVPFDWVETLPGDEFSLESTVGLETLPAITNVLTPFNVRIHWHHINYRDLWKGWKTFITKGRSGNVEDLPIPRVDLSTIGLSNYNFSGLVTSFSTPHSLASFIGIPPVYADSFKPFSDEKDSKNFLPYSFYDTDDNPPSLTGFNRYLKPCAFPFMAYQSICKYNYVPSNLLQSNLALFPEEGDDDWILPSRFNNGTNICTNVDGSVTDSITLNNQGVYSPYGYNGIYSASDTKVSLLQLRYAQFEKDYFTSALPWLQRGDVTSLPFDVQIEDIFDESIFPTSGGDGFPVRVNEGSPHVPFYLNADSDKYAIGQYLNNLIKDGAIRTNTSITANQLRELIALSVWQERNAQVDGSYNSMIWIHWNHNPKANEHLPRFVGGMSQRIDFSNVISQNSSPDSAPLGSSASRGSLVGQGSCGRFTADDYGILMGVLIISPSVTYNDGVEHALSCQNVMEDYAMPEFENLSPQPILNKEIYVSGNETTDNSLFGYQERGSYLKSRLDVNRGLFRLKNSDNNQGLNDILFSSATQSRQFDSLPKLSYQFVVQSPENTRRDWLAYPSQPMFKVQIASSIKVNRGLSYSSQPETFGF